MIPTLDHPFPDQFDAFLTIEEMAQHSSATVVLAAGALAEVTPERITYSIPVAHLFERAKGQNMAVGRLALAPVKPAGRKERECV